MTSKPTPSNSVPNVDLDAVKAKQQATWASGNFAVIGTSLQLTGELLCEAVDLEAGWEVLDVAAGNGNAALAAARRNAVVTASDYVPSLLVDAAARAAVEGTRLTTQTADAENLPFADAGFDAVLSVFGVMFAPRQQQVAGELLRVCRPGGRIGLANWTPESFVGQMFTTIARHVPPPPIVSAFNWGSESHVTELLGIGVEMISMEKLDFVFRYRSAEHFVDIFRRFYGPTHRAFGALDASGQAALEHDLTALARDWNTSSGAALAVPSEYLQVVARRR